MQKFPGLLRSDVVQSLENLLRRVLISENIPVEHLEYYLKWKGFLQGEITHDIFEQMSQDFSGVR